MSRPLCTTRPPTRTAPPTRPAPPTRATQATRAMQAARTTPIRALRQRDPQVPALEGVPAPAVALRAVGQCGDRVEEDLAQPSDVLAEDLEDLLVGDARAA